MSKHRVFIYGSCVSRDTFEHFDPDQFELVQYVARQSALSAYTRPVTLMEPPTVESSFQQRMVAGDFASSLQTLIPDAAHQTDLVLVDLTDERLGAYVLPDGSVITRSIELINSGAEDYLPAGSQYLPFGSELHFQYWAQGIAAVGELIHRHMPRAAVILLGIPWAERSAIGGRTPASFGITAAEANPIFETYIRTATRALNAEVIALSPAEVVSDPQHPWGDAPFHYEADVYQKIVQTITGDVSDARKPSGSRIDRDSRPTNSTKPETGSPAVAVHGDKSVQTPLVGGPNFLILGAHRSGTAWLQERLNDHDDVFIAPSSAGTVLTTRSKITDPDERRKYAAVFQPGKDRKFRGQRSHLFFWPVNDGNFGNGREDCAAIANEFLADDCKFLLTLRDPVSRAISAYWHSIAIGAVPANGNIFSSGHLRGILGVGFYRQHHTHWARTVGGDRITTLLYDDLVNDPQKYVSGAFDALNIPEAGRPAPDNRFSAPVNQNSASRAMRSALPLTAAEYQVLVELYRSDIEYVEEITQRDLSHWRDTEYLISLNR